MSDFEAFPKIGRFSSGKMIVSEKIDGTNAQILVPEDPSEPVLAGSRSRWITPGKQTDNFGFAAWVYDRADALREILGPGRHFGEWWGLGIQRCYNRQHKQFSLFNTLRWNPANTATAKLVEIGVGVVPVLYEGEFDRRAVDGVMAALALAGSQAAPGFMNPEGVVVFHSATHSLFKQTFEGDLPKWAAQAAAA